MRRILPVIFVLITAGHVRSQETDKVSLEQVVALAVERNYDIRIARTSAESAELDESYTWGAFVPRVNGTGSMVWNDNYQELRFNSPDRDPVAGDAASNNVSAGIVGVWTIFDGLRMFATKSRVEEISEQGELLVKNQVQNTVASVITSYYDVVRQKQQLLAIQEQMSVSEERVKLAERRFQVGTGAKPELLQARVDYNAQRAQAIQQESVIQQLKEQLNSLVGMQLPAGYDVADTIIIDLGLDRLREQEDFEKRNFDLQIARKNLRIASLAVRERRGEYYPTIDLTGAYNFSTTDNTLLLNPFSPQFIQNRGFNYGLTVSVPILNGFNQRRLVQQSRIAVLQEQNRLSLQQINTNVALRNAFTNYDNARRVLQVEEENISLARENVFIALEVFRRGASTFVELRTAQQSLLDAYTRLINARYLAKVAETELLRLNGELVR